jgi:hypothetical protein
MENFKKLNHSLITKEDQFTEIEIAPDVFNVSYQGADLKVKITPPVHEAGKNAGWPNIEIITMPEVYDYRMKKLVAYVIHVLADKYSKAHA